MCMYVCVCVSEITGKHIEEERKDNVVVNYRVEKVQGFHFCLSTGHYLQNSAQQVKSRKDTCKKGVKGGVV